MIIFRRAILLLVLMLLSTGAAMALRPTHKIADSLSTVNLDSMIPHSFGEWQEVQETSLQIIDPQQAETIARIYNQTLSRTYVNSAGYKVMLSIAYGDDQRDSVQLHYPEVCYPAQGFTIQQKTIGMLQTEKGSIAVTRIITSLALRHEPVTYWTAVGNKVVRSGVEKKLAEMRYGLVGEIPDGLLFRISSIDSDSGRAFEEQRKFVNQLLAEVGFDVRNRLAGLNI